MCGCQFKSSIKGISKMKKLNLKGMTGKVVPVLEGAIGFGAAKVFNKLISTAAAADASKAETNKMIVGGAQIAAGIFLLTQKNPHLQAVGMGIAIAGGTSFVGKYVDQALSAAGIKGINAPGYPYRYTPNNVMNGIGCASDSFVK